MKKFSIICAALMIFLINSSVLADEKAEIRQLEEQKATYEQEAQKAQAIAELIQGKIDSVSELKRQLDEEAYEATALYEERQAKLDETVYRIEENEKKYAEATEELNEKHSVLENRVRDIYINGQISYLDVLFGAKDFGDFLTRMDLLKRIIIRDSELVESVLAYQTQIKEVGEQLEADKRVQEELTAQAQSAMSVKIEKVAKQQALIDLMEHDKEIYNSQYDEMMASSAEVSRLIQAKEEEMRRKAESARKKPNSNENSGYVVQNFAGKMIWPISGPITSEFGWRTHPIFGSQRFHSGLDIGGEYGMEIHAAASGIVIESGWIGGYGNTIMIEHGSGIVTLYGHNENLAVGVGQQVNQGEVIAYCGSTGNSTGPHCHFEVRLNGEPVSPWDYL